jgi:hypothetical protein
MKSCQSSNPVNPDSDKGWGAFRKPDVSRRATKISPVPGVSQLCNLISTSYQQQNNLSINGLYMQHVTSLPHCEVDVADIFIFRLLMRRRGAPRLYSATSLLFSHYSTKIFRSFAPPVMLGAFRCPDVSRRATEISPIPGWQPA